MNDVKKQQSPFVYADNAATTKIDPRVLDAMMPYLTESYGNASSLYPLARASADAIASARANVAALIGGRPEEVFFTGCGTEADNWAIKGLVSVSKKGKHIISTKIEHHAVLHTLDALKKQGCEVTLLDTDGSGVVSPDSVKAAIRPDTALISVMAANNEIGTLQPLAEIGKIAREAGVIFHTDAVQAVGHIPLNVAQLGIDMLTMSAHKLYAPKGVGALWLRKGIRLQNLIEGGGQERGRRSGTENVASIAGFGEAARLAAAELDTEYARLCAMRDRLIKGVLETIPDSQLTGHPQNRLPGSASFTFRAVEGESLVLLLAMKGICASTGSACSTGSLDPSHVLMAIGLKHETAHGSLRLTLGRYNTEEDVDYILETLPGVVARLREMSPVW